MKRPLELTRGYTQSLSAQICNANSNGFVSVRDSSLAQTIPPVTAQIFPNDNPCNSLGTSRSPHSPWKPICPSACSYQPRSGIPSTALAAGHEARHSCILEPSVPSKPADIPIQTIGPAHRPGEPIAIAETLKYRFAAKICDTEA